MEDKEDLNESRASWLEHPHTAAQRALSPQREAMALKTLLEHCGKSSDAEVRGAFARYQEARVLSVWLVNGGKIK